MSETLKVGIVGCGRWGRNIARTLIELKVKYPLEIMGVVTSGGSANAEFARKEFGLKCEKDLSGLLNKKPAAVFIATPDETHYDTAKEALERGIAVFVEKPMALTLKDAQSLVDLAKRRNVILSAGHLLVFHSCVSKIKEHLDRTGQEPLAVFSSRLAQFPLTGGRTVLRSSLVHDISMVDLFMEELPSKSFCRSFFRPMPNPEYLDVSLEYTGGRRSHLVGSSISPENERNLALWTRDYYFHMDGLKNTLKIFCKKQPEGEYALESEDAPKCQPLYLELENFIQSISDPSRLKVQPGHILRVMGTIDLIERQAGSS